MKLLYLEQRHAYNDPSRGDSGEYQLMGQYFRSKSYRTRNSDPYIVDHCDLVAQRGEDEANKLILEMAHKHDVLFVPMIGDELLPETLLAIRERTSCKTVAFGSDCHWRWPTYGMKYAPYYDLWVTTSRIPTGPNVLLSQWAAEPSVYRPLGFKKDIDISFVGMKYGNRPAVKDFLDSRHFRSEWYGYGWENGPLPFEKMLEVIDRSKVCLNFSDASQPGIRQVKGRHFELASMGACQLCDKLPELDRYFNENEVVQWRDFDELEKKLRELLEGNFTTYGQAARKRVLAEHTWTHRFDEIWKVVM